MEDEKLRALNGDMAEGACEEAGLCAAPEVGGAGYGGRAERFDTVLTGLVLEVAGELGDGEHGLAGAAVQSVRCWLAPPLVQLSVYAGEQEEVEL